MRARRSWLDGLPTYWQVRKAAHILRMHVGGTPPTNRDEFFDGDVPWVTIADMSEGRITGNDRFLSEQGVAAANIEWSNPGDLLYSFKLSIGKTAFVSEPVVTNEAIATIQATSEIDLRFARWVLPLAFEAAAGRNIYGASILNQAQLQSARVPYPPLEEQRQIADHLDRETAEIDRIVRDELLLGELLAERRRSTIDDHFSPWLNNRIALKRLGRLRAGITLGSKYGDEVEEYPYLRVANVQAGRLDLREIKTVHVPQKVATETLLRAGDVLMTEGGDRDKLGRGALWRGEIEPVLHQNHVFAFRCNENLLPEFLVYFLESSSARTYFESTASQSTNLASTNSTIVKRLNVPNIPVDVQREIVARLDAELSLIQDIRDDLQQSVSLASERRAALISAAVTGQIDVTKPVHASKQFEDELAGAKR